MRIRLLLLVLTLAIAGCASAKKAHDYPPGSQLFVRVIDADNTPIPADRVWRYIAWGSGRSKDINAVCFDVSNGCTMWYFKDTFGGQPQIAAEYEAPAPDHEGCVYRGSIDEPFDPDNITSGYTYLLTMQVSLVCNESP